MFGNKGKTSASLTNLRKTFVRSAIFLDHIFNPINLTFYMKINSGNTKRINEYIQSHPECKQPRTLPLILQGIKNDLEVFRLPLDMVYYNISNGRFAAEYRELVAQEGGELEPEKPTDAKKIMNLLLNLDRNSTEVTKQDIIKRGQWNDGVITHDGYVIDGNRRTAILTLLSEDGTDKWKFINVARLPPNVNPTDLWKIEAGIQLGKDEIQRYGPVNELLKFREGIDAGLTVKEISKTLYGYEDKAEEIEEKLRVLKTIEDYLKFIGRPFKYKEAERKVEHFVEVQKILEAAENNGLNPMEQIQIKNIAFSLIHDSNIPHKRLRRIIKMTLNVDAKQEFFKASQFALPVDPSKVIETKNMKQGFDELVKKTIDPDLDDESENKEDNFVWTIFTNAEDIIQADENKDKVEKLLNTAKINLAAIEYNSPDLKKENSKEIIKQIIRYADKLKSFLN